MDTIYHDGNRELQDRFDTKRLADKLEEVIVSDVIRDHDKAFIESRDMFFLATADAEGRPNCSYKGGDPGFVRVLDEHTIAFPSYDGNGMYLSVGNMLKNANVGIIFIDFEGRTRLRLNGVASIDEYDPLMADYQEAEFNVRVRAREVFPNCPRYIHHYRKVEASENVPQNGCETPLADWKRSFEQAAPGVLSNSDRERA